MPPTNPTTTATAVKAAVKSIGASSAEISGDTNNAEVTPARLANEMPDRSMPPLPELIASITPIASKPSSGN